MVDAVGDERSGELVVPAGHSAGDPAGLRDELAIGGLDHGVFELDLPQLLVDPRGESLRRTGVNPLQARLDLTVHPDPLAWLFAGRSRPRVPAEEPDGPSRQELVGDHDPLSFQLRKAATIDSSSSAGKLGASLPSWSRVARIWLTKPLQGGQMTTCCSNCLRSLVVSAPSSYSVIRS